MHKYVKVSKEYITDYLKMVNNPVVSQYISLKERTFTYADEEMWVDEKLNNKALIFTMVDKFTNEFIGNIEFMHLNAKNAELGICITEDEQNKHYGYEALSKAIKLAFEKLNLEEVLLSYFSNNLRGKHLYEKLGFAVYQIDKNVGLKNGEQIDDIYMKLTKSKYAKLKK